MFGSSAQVLWMVQLRHPSNVKLRNLVYIQKMLNMCYEQCLDNTWRAILGTIGSCRNDPRRRAPLFKQRDAAQPLALMLLTCSLRPRISSAVHSIPDPSVFLPLTGWANEHTWPLTVALPLAGLCRPIWAHFSVLNAFYLWKSETMASAGHLQPFKMPSESFLA